MKKLFLVLFISLPLFLRIYTFQELSSGSLATYYAGDSLTHQEWADALRNHDWDRIFPLFRAPLYGFFLSLLPESFDLLTQARVIQHFLGLLTVVVVFMTARTFLPFKYAVSSAILFGIMPVPILMETQLYITSLYTFFSSVLIFLLIRNTFKNRRDFLLLSAVAALTILTRPNIILFVFYIVVFLLSKNREKTFLYFLIPFILALSPFIAINSLKTGNLSFISTQGLINLHAGNSSDSDGLIPLSPPLPENFSQRLPDNSPDLLNSVWSMDNMWLAERLIPSVDSNLPLSYKEISSYWLQKTLSDIMGNPVIFGRKILFKLYMLSGAKEIPNNLDPQYFLVNYLPVLSAFLIFFPFSLLSALSVTVAAVCYSDYRNKLSADKVVIHHLFYILTSIAILAVFFVNSRFRVPLLPAMSILSAYAIFRFCSSEKYSFRKGFLIIFISSFLIFSSTVFIGDSWQVKASSALFHDNLARAHLQNGNYLLAVRESDNSLGYDTNEKFIFYHTRAIISEILENNPEKALLYARKSVELKELPQNRSFLTKMEEKVKKQGKLKQ